MTALDIPAWPDPKSAEGATFFADAQMLFGLWRALRAPNLLAFALIAQAEAESTFGPNAVGDHEKATGEPTAFGLYQRHGDRLEEIKKALGIDVQGLVLAKQNSLAVEVLVTWWELSTFPYLGLGALRTATTPFGAGYQACWRFERAGAAGAALRRGQMAERWAAYFAGASLNLQSEQGFPHAIARP